MFYSTGPKGLDANRHYSQETITLTVDLLALTSLDQLLLMVQYFFYFFTKQVALMWMRRSLGRMGYKFFFTILVIFSPFQLQFCQHFMSSFCAKSLSPKNYKPKM